MKKRATVFAFALALLAIPAFAQKAPSLEELTKRRDAKLKEAFLSANPWMTDYDAVQEKAFDEDRLIFAYFTRSYSP
jgi:hypothetical protein